MRPRVGAASRARLSVAVAFTFIALPAQCLAYTYETSLSSGCHEALSWETLRAIRAEGLVASRTPSRSEQALIDDVQFTVPADMRDIDAVALVLGNRDNDVKGLSGLDPKDLAEVHGTNSFQAEHCLRRQEHDGHEGSVEALRECRAFIRAQSLRAIKGLDELGAPDPGEQSLLYVFFDFSGQQHVALPTFYVHAGHALHTLQDSFTHALRDPDDLRQITSVLNWVDEVEERREDERDGAPHLSALDDCSSDDIRVQSRYQMALTASIDLMRALLQAKTPDEKITRVDEVLGTYLQHLEGCAASNNWCDAPELDVAEQAASCSAGQSTTTSLLVLALLLFSRRNRWRSVWVATVLIGLLAASTASAQSKVEAARQSDMRFAGSARVAASIDRGGFGVGVGGRLAIDEDWWVGLDFEWNPWFSLATLRARPGTLNVFGALVWRWHHDNSLSLRTTGRLGISALLFDLVGAPSGSIGPCLGMNLLGIDIPLSDRVHFVIDPAEVLAVIPQVQGAPIAYVQYRLALGLVFF